MDGPLDYGQFAEGRGTNYWDLDPVLRREVARTYPDADREYGERALAAFGHDVATTIADNADYVDDHGPELHTYDKHGEVANEVDYPAEQRENEALAYGHGIVADSFRPPDGREEPLGPIHNLSMGYLLSYADAGFYCPVAMTAGVALVLDKFEDACDADLAPYFEGLTATDREDLVEGAMFLTEKGGGSDVGGATETTAERVDGEWRLTGEKWFCSNVDAGAKLVLARRPEAPEGMDGISLFFVPHEEEGELNDMLYRRLKDKLGTTAVPTGEVELRGATGYLIGAADEGFRYMAEMVNLERLSNAMAACGVMGRALLEAKVHAANREAFGATIDEYPLMRKDLVELSVDHEAATTVAFEAARLFDRRERASRRGEEDREAYRLMRALIPVAKYRTGRLVVDTTSYAMEILGGNGYVDDFVTNRLLRDAQVLPIWEGTSNILSLDLLRALDREDAHEPLLERIDELLDAATHPFLAELAEAVRSEYHDLSTALVTLATEDREYAQLKAKELADYVYDVTAAALLLSAAQREIDADGDARTALVATSFVDRAFGQPDARGIADGERFAVEAFDPIVRFAPVAPADLAEGPLSAD